MKENENLRKRNYFKSRKPSASTDKHNNLNHVVHEAPTGLTLEITIQKEHERRRELRQAVIYLGVAVLIVVFLFFLFVWLVKF